VKRWPHQIQTSKKQLKVPTLLDLSDAGTGKTLAALDAFAFRRKNSGKCALVVAPKALLDPAWGEDIAKFHPQLTFSVAYASNRAKAFDADVDIYITNTDAVKWIAKQKRTFFEKFDTLIIDEISYFKHRTSQRSKALKKIALLTPLHRKNEPYFKYKVGMTATPTSTSITDIWHQTLIIDGGERLGTGFAAFRDAVCQPVITNPMQPSWIKWQDKPEAQESVSQILADITVRHEFDDVMKDIPDQDKRVLNYRPSAKLMKLYEEMKKECLLELKEGDVTAVNAAALRQKLLQVASGRVYGASGAYTLDSGRNELIVELILGRAHSVVFWNWRHQREALVESLTAKKVDFVEIGSDTKDADRRSIVQEYQAGKYQTVLMHPQSGAHGLTLTKGTSAIWCSPTDRADLLVQGDARIRRGGQKLATESIRVCAVGTLEEQMYERTNEKLDAMTELMRMLK